VQGEKVSPAFTGTPTAPTAASGTANTQIATTAFVTNSPAFSGIPTAPTAAPGTITQQLATTAFVATAVTGGTATLGSIATQNANAVSITGGSLSNVTASLTGTPTAPTPTNGDSSTQIATTAFVQQNGVPTGSLLMWSLASAPTGFLLCNGSAVSRSTYASLYAVIGTTFGSGDGSTTFNLPDYRNNMPIGAGSTYSAGSTGGSADAIVVSHTHTATSVVTDPGHFHTSTWNNVNDFNQGGGSNGAEQYPDDTQGTFTVNTDSKTTGITVATTVASSGSSGTNANLPPYLGIYFIIKT
jgi:microcystin-dependent protein